MASNSQNAATGSADVVPDAEDGRDPLFRDTLFRQKRKKGQWRVVNAPKLNTSVADTHAHLQLLQDSVLSLARASAHDVHFICDVLDIYEDKPETFDLFKTWERKAAIEVRLLIGHPC